MKTETAKRSQMSILEELEKSGYTVEIDFGPPTDEEVWINRFNDVEPAPDALPPVRELIPAWVKEQEKTREGMERRRRADALIAGKMEWS